MSDHSQCRLMQILVGVCWLVLLPGCHFGFDNRKPMPTPVSVTPTPHYAPISGQVYVNTEVSLHKVADITSRAEINVESGTLVEILEAKWYYAQFRYGDDYCYMYRVQVLGTDAEGWLEHDYITSEKGGIVPVEQRCFPEGAIPTPSYVSLSGTAYINIAEEYGIAGVRQPDPRLYTRYILAHGLHVEILQSLWVHYAANPSFPEILCYMYLVRIPNTTLDLWLPEDVLAEDLDTNPNRACFPSQNSPHIYPISPSPPEWAEIYTPEPH